MKKILLISCLLSPVFFSACKRDAPSEPARAADSLPAPAVLQATYKTGSLPVSGPFRLTHARGLQANSLKEISGLAAASADRKFLWAEEDSGNKNAIYLLDTSGRFLGIKYLQGVFNIDWEDMAGGPGPARDDYYLYLGDIGDNFKIRPFIAIYRFQEPDLAAPADTVIPIFDAITLAYPDGAHNAEALMIDPATKDLYVITKDSVAGVYVARYPQNVRELTRLTLLARLPISTVTAADISADGSQILVKNYDDIFYWKRKAGESIADCLMRAPLRLNYKREPQGEAIAWSRDGNGFYTLSEQVGGQAPTLYHYEFF